MKQLTKVKFTKYYWGIGLVWYIIFAWYDLWVGIYFDRKTGKIYISLIPTIVVVLKFYKIIS